MKARKRRTQTPACLDDDGPAGVAENWAALTIVVLSLYKG